MKQRYTGCTKWACRKACLSKTLQFQKNKTKKQKPGLITLVFKEKNH